MRTAFAISIALLLALVPGSIHIGSSATGWNLPISTRQGVVATIGLGVEDQIGQVTKTKSGTTTTYSDGNYKVTIEETASRARSILRVIVQKASGEAFPLDNFFIDVVVPRFAVQGIWYPGANPSSTNVMVTDASQSINDVADANYGIPYLAASAGNSRNVLAMGFGRQDLSVGILGQPVSPSFYEFRLTALTPGTATIFDQQFYLSTDSSMTWFEAAGNYSDWVDGLNNYQPFPVSSSAYEPLYDAWYWAGDNVNDQLYKQTAQAASDVGIGMYLADSGWDAEAGEWVKWLAGSTGDYNPPADKFTDLAQTFNDIRSQNKLGINLWLQPFALGRQSYRYPGTAGSHIQLPTTLDSSLGWIGQSYSPFTLPFRNNLEDVNLCPRLASTTAYVKNLFTDVAEKYNPEGYWLDFIDGMPAPCVAGHTHTYNSFSDGLKQSLNAIKQTILAHNPMASVHFRARYANLNLKSYASVWQSGDSPNDFDRMRLNSIRLRPFSKGVVFGADETYWPDSTPEPQVAKFIMTSVMIGVPAFGPTLIYSPKSTLDMMKAWLTFYRSNKQNIATGAFSPFGPLQMPNHKIEGQDSTYVYVRSPGPVDVTASGSTIYLMNATDADEIKATVHIPVGAGVYYVTVLNRFLVPEPAPMKLPVMQNKVVHVDAAVEQGGMAILTPTGEPSPQQQRNSFVPE